MGPVAGCKASLLTSTGQSHTGILLHGGGIDTGRCGSHIGGMRYLITGGTGAFGRAYVGHLLGRADVERVVVYSRDEAKQARLLAEVRDPRLRTVVGDVRDQRRLEYALAGVHRVVHAAALKRVEVCELAPTEAEAVNVGGTRAVVEACLATGVAQRVLLSTDKACQPNTAYGATKLMAERVVWWANVIGGPRGQRFSATRYGNVWGSTGSLVPILRQRRAEGKPFVVRGEGVTRFWMRMAEAVDLVDRAFHVQRGGEVVVPKLRAATLDVVAASVDPAWPVEREPLGPMEKQHEALLSPDEQRHTRDMGWGYVVEPHATPWRSLEWPARGFLVAGSYTSDAVERIPIEELRTW